MELFLGQNDKSLSHHIRERLTKFRMTGKTSDKSQLITNIRGNQVQALSQVQSKKLAIKCYAIKLIYSRQSNLIQYSQRQTKL
jgi:hypothetical protein